MSFSIRFGIDFRKMFSQISKLIESFSFFCYCCLFALDSIVVLSDIQIRSTASQATIFLSIATMNSFAKEKKESKINVLFLLFLYLFSRSSSSSVESFNLSQIHRFINNMYNVYANTHTLCESFN